MNRPNEEQEIRDFFGLLLKFLVIAAILRAFILIAGYR